MRVPILIDVDTNLLAKLGQVIDQSKDDLDTYINTILTNALNGNGQKAQSNTLAVDKELLENVAKVARANKITVDQAVRSALQRYVKNNGK